MPEAEVTADRLAAYSDAVFAVIVTVMVLELKKRPRKLRFRLSGRYDPRPSAMR
jgi:uncharacterized membrane protein